MLREGPWGTVSSAAFTVCARVHERRSAQAERRERGRRSLCQRFAERARRAPRAHGRACLPARARSVDAHRAPQRPVPTRAPSADREAATGATPAGALTKRDCDRLGCLIARSLMQANARARGMRATAQCGEPRPVCSGAHGPVSDRANNGTRQVRLANGGDQCPICGVLWSARLRCRPSLLRQLTLSL